MYSLEHEAQPEVFQNAFSGIWWAASTLLTVGYGDIYPITIAGKLLGIVITFWGAGMIAIPTGIISAGFVDQYSNIKKRAQYGYESDMHFIKIRIRENDKWMGMRIRDLDISRHTIIVLVKRRNKTMLPNGNMILQEGDRVFLYTKQHLLDVNEIDI